MPAETPLPQTRHRWFILLGLAGVGAALAGFVLRRLRRGKQRTPGHITAPLDVQPTAIHPTSPMPQTSVRWRIARWPILLIGMVMLAALAESNGQILGISRLQGLSIHTQFAFLLGGIGQIGFVFGGGNPLRTVPPLLTRKTTLALAAITLLAFTLRAWNLEQAVFMYVDEFGSVLTVVTLRDGTAKLLIPSWEIAGWSQTYGYLQMWTSEWFGSNLYGLRAPSVLIGTLTVPALYGLATVLFNRRTALLAALWLATFPPHVHFSRLGVPNVVDPLFGVIMLAGMARGWQTGSRQAFVVAGVALGLTQYFYEAGRLLFPALAVAYALTLLLAGCRDKQVPQHDKHNGWTRGLNPLSGKQQKVVDIPTLRRARRNGLAVTALIALLLAVPPYYALAGNNISPAVRFDTMNVAGDYLTALRDTPGEFASRYLLPPFLHYVSLPDQSQLYYGGEHGLIEPILVPLFLFGIGGMLWRWRRPEHALLLLWLAGAALGNGLIQQNVFSSRYVVTLPALVLVLAVGYDRLTRWRGWQQLDRRGLIALAVAVIVAIYQVAYYFGPHLERYNRQIRPFRDFAEIVPRSREFPPRTQVHLISDDSVSLWQFNVLENYFRLTYPFDWLPANQLTADYLLQLPRGVDHAFYVVAEDSASVALINRYFLVSAPQYSPNNVPLDRQYVLYYAPADAGR